MKTPKAPDPVKTAQAQAGLNTDTALTQQMINMTNQVGPWGSTTYSPTGSSSYVDSTGRTITIPQYTATTQYSPEQQAIFDKTTQAENNLAQIAVDQSANVSNTLKDPFQFNNQDAADWSYDLAQSRIRPQQEQNRQALESRLINSGIRPGTAAYDRELTRYGNGVTDQNNQLALTGRAQAFNEAIATRNQPLNELSALLSQSQVSNPNTGFTSTPQAQVGGVDYTGLVNQQYQAKLQSQNAMLGGLFGLAGAGITKYSDARIKENIVRVGTLDNGLPVYRYNYTFGGPTEIGLLAQDVEKFRPEAVSEVAGLKAVNYKQATA